MKFGTIVADVILMILKIRGILHSLCSVAGGIRVKYDSQVPRYLTYLVNVFKSSKQTGIGDEVSASTLITCHVSICLGKMRLFE